MNELQAAALLGILASLCLILGTIQLALMRIGTALRDLRDTLNRKSASEALFRREQTYGALRDRAHKGDGRG